MGNDIFSAVIELNKIRQQAYEIQTLNTHCLNHKATLHRK